MGSLNFVMPIHYRRDVNVALSGGRKTLEYHTSDLQQAVERLVEPTERGDPQTPLRWTCKF